VFIGDYCTLVVLSQRVEGDFVGETKEVARWELSSFNELDLREVMTNDRYFFLSFIEKGIVVTSQFPLSEKNKPPFRIFEKVKRELAKA
jgi:hypothetical protein